MRNISELIGIIKGINFDGVINDKEVERLQTWVNKNRNLAIDAKDISSDTISVFNDDSFIRVYDSGKEVLRKATFEFIKSLSVVFECIRNCIL